MIIDYTITKKHGNFRPELNISIKIEQWEKDLNPCPQIVKLKAASDYSSCIPYSNENAEKKTTDVEIEINQKLNNTYKLHMPYRPGKNPAYPEIDQALNELREKWEAAVLEAHDSIAFEISKKIEPSEPYKKKIAPWVAKQKMMKSAEVSNE